MFTQSAQQIELLILHMCIYMYILADRIQRSDHGRRGTNRLHFFFFFLLLDELNISVYAIESFLEDLFLQTEYNIICIKG